MITVSDGIIKALIIQQYKPDYYLCGSLALILKEIIPPREMNDLDFSVDNKPITFENYDPEIKYNRFKDETDNYACYRMDRDNWHYNVFRHTKPIRTEVFHLNKFQSLILQNTNDILRYKEDYSRSKDITDLKYKKQKEEDALIIPY